jgi:putative membrane protein
LETAGNNEPKVVSPPWDFNLEIYAMLGYFRGEFFMKSTIFVLCSSVALWVLPLSPLLSAADMASPTDRAFVGKVSQGGMYEVEASKIAEQKATAQNVKDLAIMEVHDHDLVNRELRKIAASEGTDVSQQLNAAFQQRLAQLKGNSGTAFDAVYINDMAQIHDIDEKLFAREAVEGSSDFKLFAANTDVIVKRHIGAIHGPDAK